MKSINYTNSIDYKRVKNSLSSERFEHTLRVLNLALELGEIYKVNLEKIFFASIYHDYAKEWSNVDLINFTKKCNYSIDEFYKKMPHLLHGVVAAIICERNGWILNKSVLYAIKYHTVGSPKLDTLGKIVYVADALEPNRKYKNIDFLREIVYKNLDLAVIYVAEHTVEYLKSKNLLVHENTLKMITSLKDKINNDGGNHAR